MAGAYRIEIERHLGRLLNAGGHADEIVVIQRNRDRFDLALNSQLLLDLFKVKPAGVFYPRRMDFAVEDLGDDAWRFNSQSSCSFSFDAHDNSLRGPGVYNAKSISLSGLFDPRAGSESRFALAQSDVNIESKLGTTTKRGYFGILNYGLTETTGADGLSGVTIHNHLEKVTFVNDMPGTREVLAMRKFDYHAVMNGLDYRSLKGMLRFGDRLMLHNSEGEADYPASAVMAASDYYAGMHLEGISSKSNREGITAENIDLYMTAKNPDETAKNTFALSAKELGYPLKLPDRDLLVPLLPRDIHVSGNLTGFDYRLLHLFGNLFSRVGLNNDLDYIGYSMVPDRKLTFDDLHGQVTIGPAKITVKGSIKIDLNKPAAAILRLNIRTRDLDKLLAVNREKSLKYPDSAKIQFALSFAKGLAHSLPDGTLEWALSRRDDGGFFINGQKPTFPTFPRFSPPKDDARSKAP